MSLWVSTFLLSVRDVLVKVVKEYDNGKRNTRTGRSNDARHAGD